MQIAELPVGARIYLGSRQCAFSEEEQMVWQKVNDDGDFILTNAHHMLEFDAAEPQGSNRERRAHGGNCFLESNIRQWLNSDGYDWYAPQHSADAPPTYAGIPGFLSQFDSEERSLLIPRTITCRTPNGYKKKYGDSITFDCLVSLPSLSEVSSGHSIYEGESFVGFPTTNFPAGTFLTRTCFDYGVATAYMDTFMRTPRVIDGSVMPNKRRAIAPVIRIKPETKLEGTPDDSGVFYIETKSSYINLDDILKF